MIISDKILERLQKPINESNFCGTYLKLDRQAFRSLRNTYNEANSFARKLLQTPDESEIDELKENNISSWNKLSDQLVNTFENQTKDIELLSWLLVSQIYVDESLVGFRNSLKLLKFLINEHWDSLNPNLPEANIKSTDEKAKYKEIIEFRVNAFSQMTGIGESDSILYAPLAQLCLVGDTSYFVYQSSEMKGTCLKLKEDLKKIADSNKDNYKNLISIIKDCISIIKDIYADLAKICQPQNIQTPNFSFLLTLLDKMLKLIGFITDLEIEERKEQEDIATVQDTSKSDNSETVTNATPSNNSVQTVAFQTIGVVNNAQSFALLKKNSEVTREQVFDELKNIASYFKSTEPHSPVSYLIEKAIRWGHMSLPDLLNEMISDQVDTRNRIFTIAGLQEGGTFSSFEPSMNSNSNSINSNNSPSNTTASSSQQKNEDVPNINW